MLRHFQLPYLEKEGYVNIRCAWALGCPAEIKPLEEEGEHRAAVHAGGQYKAGFEMLFPELEVPKEVGVSCCAQFAVTKEKIRERKKEDYVRYREWLLTTELEDSISGRILEYSWHSRFLIPIALLWSGPSISSALLVHDLAKRISMVIDHAKNSRLRLCSPLMPNDVLVAP